MNPRLTRSATFTEPYAAEDTLSYHRRLRDIGKYVDLLIETAGGKGIRAHRWVLEARFPVLRRQFRGNVRKQRLDLKRYSTEAVQAVVDYAYGTSLKVTEDNVLKILLLGRNLDCAEIAEWCRAFICPRINEVNFREVWKVGNLSSDETLICACVPMMMAHFVEALRDPLLLEASEARGLRQLLSHEQSSKLSALSRVSAVAAWVKAAPTREVQQQRTAAFPDLVGLINFDGVSHQELVDFLFEENVAALPASNKELLRERMKASTPVPSTSHAVSRRHNDFWALCSNVLSQQLTRVTLDPCRCEEKLLEVRRGSGYAVRDGHIYITGGVEDSSGRVRVCNKFESIHTVNDQRTSLPSMYATRQCHACIATERFLYVFGGYDRNNELTSTCERYSWTQGRQAEHVLLLRLLLLPYYHLFCAPICKWERIPAMYEGRAFAAVVRIPGLGILVIGGELYDQWFNEVEFLRLDGDTEGVTSWRRAPQMLRWKERPSACYFRGSILVCNEDTNFLDFERYNTTTGECGQWTRIDCDFYFRKEPTRYLLPLNGSLWIIGGFGQMYEVELVEDEWGETNGCKVTVRNRIEGLHLLKMLIQVFPS